MDFVEGEILYIDKPLHWTSFFLVKKVRNKLCRELGVKKLKVGHAGTLDPLATGVMIVCTGKKTKMIESFQYQTKEYIAEVKLGSITPSFDLETEVDATYPSDHITEALINEALLSFVGEIQQIPPEYSACKVDGKRAYDFARQGQEVELKPKTLVIDEIEMLGFENLVLKIRVVCSKGTYIRALARDIGRSLNSGGHLISLRRTRVGETCAEHCVKGEEIEEYINSIFTKSGI